MQNEVPQSPAGHGIEGVGPGGQSIGGRMLCQSIKRGRRGNIDIQDGSRLC